MKSYFLRQINIILIIASIISLNGCGIYKYTDSREVSPNPDERVKKNIEEGKGLRLATLGEKMEISSLPAQTLFGGLV